MLARLFPETRDSAQPLVKKLHTKQTIIGLPLGFTRLKGRMPSPAGATQGSKSIHGLQEPIQTGQRIMSDLTHRQPILDIVRGFALLGILVMNIQSFAMPDAVYYNPTAYTPLSGWDSMVWAVSYLLADEKFMALFGMLFGAGILLFAHQFERQGRSPYPAFYRRLLALGAIGLAHAYFIWYGDILVTYVLAAAVVIHLRHRSALTLMTLSVGALGVASVLQLILAHWLPTLAPELYEELVQEWQPDHDRLLWEIEIYRGSYLDTFEHRVDASLTTQTLSFAAWGFWRSCGLMLMGMALLKSGVLDGRRSTLFYQGLVLAGVLFGISAATWGLVGLLGHDFQASYSLFIGTQWNYWGSIPLALGYLGLIILWGRRYRQQRRARWMADFGRQSLTQYLLQSLLATSLFYGYGLGLFGELTRTELLAVVVAIWLCQLATSRLIVHTLPCGPAEWVLRRAAYGSLRHSAPQLLGQPRGIAGGQTIDGQLRVRPEAGGEDRRIVDAEIVEVMETTERVHHGV